MMRTTICILLFVGLQATPATAQKGKKPQQQTVNVSRTDTSIKGTTLEVYQVYQPELKPITKPELSPTLPPQSATRPEQQYDVPQQTLYYSYRAMPLRPLALGKDTAALPPANYALLGGGNLSTILGEVGIGGLHGKDWNSALMARYITQEGEMKDQVFRSFRFRGTGALHQGKHLLHASLDAKKDVRGLYGYNHDLVHYPDDTTRVSYTGAGVNIGVNNEAPGWEGIDYQPSFSASFFTGTFVNSERTFGIHLPVSKRIDSSLTAEMGIHAILTSADISGVSVSNNVLQITPALSYTGERISGRFGLYPTFGRDGVYLLPDIIARYKIGNDVALASAGWQSRLVQNTFEQLITVNPFLTRLYQPLQTRTDEVFAGVGIAILKHLSISGRISWWQYNNLPLYVTRAGGDGKDFDLVFDPKVQAIVLNAGLRYAIGEDITVGGSGTWYNYSKHTFARVWGEPAVRLKGDATWHATTGLTLTAYLEVLDQIYGSDINGKEVKQKGVFEVGAGAEYTIVQKLNIFLRAENLLNRQNERWLGYPSFGFNIYGGLRFRF